MTTSLTPCLSELFEDGRRIPDETLEFLRERLRGMLHQLVLREFLNQSRSKGLQRKDLATKLGRRREQITRWLNQPSNREVDTVSDLLAAMGIVPMRIEVARALDLVEAEAADAAVKDRDTALHEAAHAALSAEVVSSSGLVSTVHIGHGTEMHSDPSTTAADSFAGSLLPQSATDVNAALQ